MWKNDLSTDSSVGWTDNNYEQSLNGSRRKIREKKT